MRIVTKQEKVEVGIGESEVLRSVVVRDLAAPKGISAEVVCAGEGLTLWVGNEFAEFTLAEWEEFLRSVSTLLKEARDA